MRPALVCILLAGIATATDPLQVGGDFRGDLERYLTSLASAQGSAREKKIAQLQTRDEILKRQTFIRNWLMDAVGGLPPKTPLNPRITGTLDREGYKVEKLIFESMPRFYVTANVYVPTSSSGPFPAVLGVAGHSDTGKAIDTYQHVWISLARRGFIVLAFDPPGQGERLEYLDPATGKSTVGIGVREHIMAGLQCLLTGTTIARYEAVDGIRAFDYLLTRKDVDPARIAVAGNSGGGTQAAYLATLEPRLAAAVTSCYITSWKTLWAAPGPQDSEQIFPDFLKDGLDFGDFLLAFVPKPIQMTTAVQDFFPIAGARSTFAEAERLFRIADAPGRVGYFEFDDKHGWSQPRREAAYRWFAKWMQSRSDDDGAEAVHTVEAPADLNVTASGQVASSLKGETVQSLNQARAEALFSGRTALRSNPAQLRKTIEARLRVTRPAGAVTAQSAGPVSESIEKLKIRTEGGLDIPALLFRSPGNTPRGAVIWIDSSGKSAHRDTISKWIDGGESVLAIDPRGMGENGKLPSPASGYTPDYQLAMRALLTGKTMLGMQVADALHAWQYLRSRDEMKDVQIRIAGWGEGAAVALLAAAIEPEIAGAASETPVRSWMDIARSQTYTDSVNLIVPGVLHDFDLPDLEKLIAPRALRVQWQR